VFCLGEFVRVVTHPRVFDPPSSMEAALAALGAFLAGPSVIRGEGDEHLKRASGPRISC